MSIAGDFVGLCWLCGKYGSLTLEHVPPKAAFNKYPLLLQEVSRRSSSSGELSWDDGPLHLHGLSHRSLCARCNNKAGQRFAPAYIDFVKTVAERVGNVHLRHQLTIQKVRKPQLVLRQIVMQFVTMNGKGFATANPWVRPFLQPESRTLLPPELHVYLFAVNKPTVRTTGITGHIDARLNTIQVVSEFTYWPLGTVMSYCELEDDGLAAIHHWDRIPYKASETADVSLCVNPTDSAMPLDFRTDDEILADQGRKAVNRVSESSLFEMMRSMRSRSGRIDDESMILTGSPSQLEMLGD